MKLLLAGLFAGVLLAIPMLDGIAHAGANVFLYHRFDEPHYSSTNIDIDVFAEQLAYLQENQYRVLSLKEVVRRLEAGEPFPEKSAALSVDDSFRSFKEQAMPLIRLYQYPVTLFVNSGSVGTSGYLSWKELRALALEGVDIGNHSSSHDHLIDVRESETREQWTARVRQDIEKAQLLFEKHLKLTPDLLAYPYGEYNLALAELVQEMGFAAAFCQQSGVIHGTSNLMTLPRFPMGGPYATLKGFREKVHMKPLVVSQENPAEPVIAENNPPVLELLIDAGDADLGRMNCFVQGDNRCEVAAIKDRPGAYRVTAEKPLTGRRNKYTLTAPNRSGSGWYWYSQLWINSSDAVNFVK